MADNILDMDSVADKLIQNDVDAKEFSKNQIIVIETNKESFQKASKNLDKSILDDIDIISDAQKNLKQAYLDRISANCKSDLFWRVVGINTISEQIEIECTRLSATYPKFQNTFDGQDLSGYGINEQSLIIYETPAEVSPIGINSVQFNYRKEQLVVFGNQLTSEGNTFFDNVSPIDNKYGIKYYEEPYSRDLFETFIGGSIGTVSAGSTILYLLTPGGVDFSNTLKQGSIITVEPSSIFSGSSNTVVGIGTTFADLSDIPLAGVTTTISTVNFIIMEDAASQTVTAPLSGFGIENGDYASFLFSKTPDEVSTDFSVDFGASPYVPQTISIMKRKQSGSGVRIEIDNSGNPTGTAQWNPFLEGLPNPDDVDEVVTEPIVGAGKINYPKGFDEYASKFSGGNTGATNQERAEEGERLTVTASYIGSRILPYSPGTDIDDYDPYELETGTSCNSFDPIIQSASDALDAAEITYGNAASDTQLKVGISNAIKDEINQLNLRVWGHRIQIGKSNEDIASQEKFKNLLTDPKFKDIIDGD